MRLSVREQRQLDTIGEAVSQSDVQLAAMLATFSRLTAGEPMPDREQLTRLAAAEPDGRGTRSARQWRGSSPGSTAWTPRASVSAEPDREHHAA